MINIAPPFKALFSLNVEFEMVAFLPSTYIAPPPVLFSVLVLALAWLLSNSLDLMLMFSPYMWIAPPSVGIFCNTLLSEYLKSSCVA